MVWNGNILEILIDMDNNFNMEGDWIVFGIIEFVFVFIVDNIDDNDLDFGSDVVVFF